VLTAEATHARIVAFNVATTPTATVLAQEKGVPIERYDVIYHLEKAVRNELEKLLAPELRQTIVGQAKVLAIFRQERSCVIAGGTVTDGHLTSGLKIRILRDQREIGTGKIVELQSAKRAISDVRAGQEFGMKLETKIVPVIGDSIEAYTEEQVARALDS
jgi:translation initiation factor IF-2